MTAQKMRATTDGVHEHFVEAWLERWDEDDPRREVFRRFGVVVRQPCVARILVGAGQLERRTGWRSTTAFALMASLMRDMPHKSAAIVLRRWNDGLGEPIEDSKLEGIIRHADENSDAPRPECDHADLGSWCGDKDDCDWYRDNRESGGTRPRGAAAILEHGKPALMKTQELSVYEALCTLEEATERRAGAPVPTAARTVGDLVGVDKNAVKPALAMLEQLGYVRVVDSGDGGTRRASLTERVFPLPMHLNDVPVDAVGDRPLTELKEGVAARSDILEDFIASYSEPVSGDVLDYVLGRGITVETIELVRLRGCTKAGSVRVKETFGSKVSREELRVAGLSEGFFRALRYHPLLIPYYVNGRVVAIKSRSLLAHDSGDTPRYVNSGKLPDAYFPVPIGKGADVVVCEGEMDALSALQLGFRSLALTTAKRFPEELVQRLKGSRVVLALDADATGRTGATSAEDKLSAAGVSFARLDLPYGDLNALLLDDSETLCALLEHAFDSMSAPDGTGRGVYDDEPKGKPRDPRFKGLYEGVVVGSPASPPRDMTPAELETGGVGDAPTGEVDDAQANFERIGEALRKFF